MAITYGHTDTQTYIHTDRQTDRQTEPNYDIDSFPFTFYCSLRLLLLTLNRFKTRSEYTTPSLIFFFLSLLSSVTKSISLLFLFFFFFLPLFLSFFFLPIPPFSYIFAICHFNSLPHFLSLLSFPPAAVPDPGWPDWRGAGQDAVCLPHGGQPHDVLGQRLLCPVPVYR